MEAAQARLSLNLSKCHIVGNHMSQLIWLFRFLSSVLLRLGPVLLHASSMWIVNDCVMCNVNDCVRMISRWIWLSYNFVSISADRLIGILLKIDIIDFIKCKNTTLGCCPF